MSSPGGFHPEVYARFGVILHDFHCADFIGFLEIIQWLPEILQNRQIHVLRNLRNMHTMFYCGDFIDLLQFSRSSAFENSSF